MNAVRIVVSPPFLAEILRLPAGTVVSGFIEDPMTGHLVLLAEHGDLPAVPAGESPRQATPSFRKNYEHLEPSVEFIEWGIS